MKGLLPVTILLFPFLLTGCEQESDSSPADGRDFNAQAYVAGTPYTGRVMNGYLRNARVWLDMDGDGQYTPGPLTLENESGVEVVLPGGEPTAMTGEDGLFSLDVSELEQDPLISPDLDPRDYSLFALALPGQTEEQTDAGNQLLEQAFMLSAPPGVRNVTPLTTLVRGGNASGEFVVGSDQLESALGNINLVSDYVRAGNARAQAYAGAFARFRASQLPQDYKDILRAGDGTDRFLTEGAVKLMSISFTLNALTIVEIVDEAAALENGDYAAVDVDGLGLPEIELELEDSVIVSGQTVFARASALPGQFANVERLAELGFKYGEDGRLTSVVANGCMTPSLKEMVRVINADGKISSTETQWVPTLSLNQQSGSFYDEVGTDERLTFDWENDTAAFETRTTCHGLADSSELGGPPEIQYQWTLSNNRVAELTATSNGKTEVLTPDYSNGSDFFIGYTRTVTEVSGAVEETKEEVLSLDSPVQSCVADIAEIDAEKPQVVSAFQPFTLTGTVAIPGGFSNLALELDTRTRDEITYNRPLRYAFTDEELRNTEGVDSSVGFEWRFFYPRPTFASFVAEQPNLIRTAYLVDYSGEEDCARDFGSRPVSFFARVEYSYLLLSEYLGQQVQ